jgi:hypothetical protein
MSALLALLWQLDLLMWPLEAIQATLMLMLLLYFLQLLGTSMRKLEACT